MNICDIPKVQSKCDCGHDEYDHAMLSGHCRVRGCYCVQSKSRHDRDYENEKNGKRFADV